MSRAVPELSSTSIPLVSLNGCFVTSDARQACTNGACNTKEDQRRSSRSRIHASNAVQSVPIPIGSFAINIHPSIRTRQLRTAEKGGSAIFCTKKEGYLGVCQATKRVDSTGERLYYSHGLYRIVSLAICRNHQDNLIKMRGSYFGSGDKAA